jgi:hypothetical protein
MYAFKWFSCFKSFGTGKINLKLRQNQKGFIRRGTSEGVIRRGTSEGVHQRWTDNTMAKRKRTKGQTPSNKQTAF